MGQKGWETRALISSSTLAVCRGYYLNVPAITCLACYGRHVQMRKASVKLMINVRVVQFRQTHSAA